MELARVQPFQTPGRRRTPRYAISVPVSITVLRSGVPEGVPGRSVDVCEGGLCAVLAAELFPGEMVGVEFRLPHLSLSVLAKAKVRHHDRLRCGMQFLGLSGEQQATIRYWAERTGQRRTLADMAESAAEPELETEDKDLEEPTVLHVLPAGPAVSEPEKADELPKTGRGRWDRQTVLVSLLAFALAAAGMVWWRWEQGWQDLEARLPGRQDHSSRPAMKVSADVMQHLIVHKVDPITPVNASGAKITGTVVLDAVIGSNGNVLSLRPVSGPEALTRAAADAVRWWRFEPYRSNGEAVEVETPLAIEFQ